MAVARAGALRLLRLVHAGELAPVRPDQVHLACTHRGRTRALDAASVPVPVACYALLFLAESDTKLL